MPGNPARDPIAHFLSNSIPEPNSGCHLWLGPYSEKGYGILTTPGGKWKAHRLALLLSQPWPAEYLLACHRCDMPACVNPDHLFWGTNADNQNDKIAKGRGRSRACHGEENKRAKLTETDVRVIRTSGESSPVLAKLYNINQSGIRKIRTRETWKHIP